MAYAAVTSLKHTIHLVLNSPRISATASTRAILETAYHSADALQNVLGTFDEIKNCSQGVKASDARIRDEARRLEDTIESHVSTIDHLGRDLDRFAANVETMADEYMQELNKPDEDDAAVFVSPLTDYYDGGNELCSSMVGSPDQFYMIRGSLLDDLEVRITSAISGMAGIGKTTLARKIFHDQLIEASFEAQAFVRVGRRYHIDEILLAMIVQVNLDNDEMIVGGGDEDLEEYLQRILMGKKYLIVLDDIWDDDSYHRFTRKLPDEFNGSRILFIARETRVARSICSSSTTHEMRFLDEEESWELLRKKVFGEEGECPLELVKAGMKIAKNCEGLPLLILTVAKHLSEAEKSLEYWEKVAEKQNSVFDDACDQISDILSPSYHYAIQNLKACFLYMGAFPQDYMVRRSRIINLWRVERFVEYFFGDVSSPFDELVSTNLVVARHRSANGARVKACSLHVAYRLLNRREGESIKFLYIFKRFADGSIERVEGQRCVAVYNNILLAIKEVRDSMASNATVRSLLCTGPYQQYQVPIYSGWRLLGVLDALTIRFYEFPVEIVKLFHLKHLSLTTNAELPHSISKLWNLHYLIIHQHLSIKRVVSMESYVPVEIWDLQELEHLQIMGRNLPDPPLGVFLPKLTKLLDVGVQSCTKGVLEGIPNLEKLRIQIELAPEAAETLSCFYHVSRLGRLESLQSIIVNPTLLREHIVPPLPLSITIPSLRKLTLSGLGYPWGYMSQIAQLPNLDVLKLQCYAFRGEKWEVNEGRFLKLTYLFVEDTDVVQWRAGEGAFPWLWMLTMKNCHRLREIPSLPFTHIELLDCNPLAEAFAKQRDHLIVNAKYSWK